MVAGRRGVTSLLKVCLVAVQKLVTAAATKRSWPAHKTSLTHFIHAAIPHHLRQQLQESVLKEWRIYDTVTLRVLELLMSPTTSSLRVTHVRTFYRDAFVNLLPRLTGLTELSIQDPVWTLSRRQLDVTAGALASMNQLRVLIMQYCAHDHLLAAVGANCPHLQVVDVRGSRGVTDEGVWTLVTLSPGSAFLSLEGTSAKQKVTQKFRNCWGAAVRSLKARIVSVITEALPDEAEDEELPGELVMSWCRCCDSLSYLDLRCTRVTSVGLSILAQALQPSARIVKDVHGYLT